jgi:uncharacterized protein (DUF2141 family)
LIVLSLLLLFSIATQSQTLQIQINKIRSDKGNILVSVYNSEKGFPYDGVSCILMFSKKAVQGSISITTTDLTPGRYAIALFHDVDGNRKLTTNILGIPKEGYAFSNDASNIFGVPSFKDASFQFKADTSIVIHMKHF